MAAAHPVYHNFTYENMRREYMFIKGKIPDALVVILHPFQSTPERTLARFNKLRERGFSLLLPHGFENSWNGMSCCGKALELGLNDIGFLHDVTLHVLREQRIRTINAYILGISNGAFLASKLALTAIARGDPWVNAVAMIAGYSYETSLYAAAIRNQLVTKETAFPVLGLHGADDTTVRPEGCCFSGKPCCCNIIAQHCVTLDYEFEQWSDINKCRQKAIGGLPIRHLAQYNVSCSLGKDCIEPVTICRVPGAGHRLDDTVPVDEIVTEFFFTDYVRRSDMIQVKEESIEGKPEQNIIRNPPTDAPGRPFSGVIVVAVFLIALFFFLSRVFKKTKPASPLDFATARERQALTGRPPSTVFSVAQV